MRLVRQVATWAPLIPYHLADMDVVILIGLLRWKLGMKRAEIKQFLHLKGLDLSEGTISNSSFDFLLLFRQLHRDRSDKIKKSLTEQVGIILHVDGTHESGGRVIFVLQEDRYEIILDAAPIPSEGKEHVCKLLTSYKHQYGTPLVIVRDMSESIKSALSEVFPEVPQQICQVHFLRNIERTLLTELHGTLKKLIVKHHLTSRLGLLRIGDTKSKKDIRDMERLWVHVAVDYLFHPVKKQARWLSLAIPYYYQYQRIKEISILTQRLIQWNASMYFVCEPVMKLFTLLRKVLEDIEVRIAFNVIHRTVQWLDLVREPLRISRTTHLQDIPPEKLGIRDVEILLRSILVKITKEGQELGNEYHRVASIIKKEFDRHWDELFIPYPLINGTPIWFRRHNNTLERSHRWARKSIRQRTGREQTQIEMEKYGDLLAIVSNLWNPVYQQQIMGDIENLSHMLGKYIPELPRLRREYHLGRRGPERPIADEKRISVLEGFLRILESSFDGDSIMEKLVDLIGEEAGEICLE